VSQLPISDDASFIDQLVILRMMRLIRLVRAVRLITLFQTLWMLVQGMLYSVKTLAWTAILLSILIYMLALLGMEFIQPDLSLPLDHPYNVAVLENFSDLQDACFMLLQFFSYDSISGVYRPIVAQSKLLFLYFMTVLLILSIALMNLVTAIMVEGSLAQGNEDKATKKAMENVVRMKKVEELKKMFAALDDDGSGELSLDEIDKAPPDVMASLIEIAETDDIHTLFHMLDYDGGGTVGTDEFCDGVMKATDPDKPNAMELGRLLKQCSDILHDSRDTVAILNGEEPPGSSAASAFGSDNGDEDDGNDREDVSFLKPSPEPPEAPGPFGQDSPSGVDVATFVVDIEGRVSAIENTLEIMKADTREILSLISGSKISATGSKTAVTTTGGIKKAVAVCRGPARTRPAVLE